MTPEQTAARQVQRILDRLVVVRFAEDHLIAPSGTPQSIYDLRQRYPYIFPLNQNVKAGNSLIGAGPDDPRLDAHAAALAELRGLRLALAAESDNDPHDAKLERTQQLTGQVTAALDAGLAAHFGDVAGQRPFHWAVEFPRSLSTPRGGRWARRAASTSSSATRRGRSTSRTCASTTRVAHRRIARSTDARTLIAAMVAPGTACEVNATVALIRGNDDQRIKLFLCAALNSLVLDYIIRYKVSTTLNMFYMYQLPLPRGAPGNPYFDAIVPRAARLTCTRAEFAELWQAVMGEVWTPASGATAPVARQQLRNELDALVAHLYGLSRSEFAHILDAFPLVFPDDAPGKAKRAALLSVYDGMG